MHMDPRVDIWFHGYLAEKGVVNWEMFAQDICKRFDSSGDVVEEFNKLTQHGTVEEYQEQIEDLRSQLLDTNSHFAQEYFLSSFLSGLKEEIRTAVKMMHPSSLTQAFELARLQEQNIATVMKKSRVWFKSQGSTLLGSGYKGNSLAAPARLPDNTRNYANKIATERFQPSRQLIEQRRAAGLCLKSGEKYSFGH